MVGQSVVPRGSGDLIEAVVARGNLRDLNPAQRASWYVQVCESIGVNPLTRPFEYVELGGKLVLYATRACADQLRAKHGISISVLEQVVSTEDQLAIVRVRGTTQDGRADEELGIVSVAGLRGEALANARLKALTKAKRRVTLALVGLGMLDETEVQDAPGARRVADDSSPAVTTTAVSATVLPASTVAVTTAGDARLHDEEREARVAARTRWNDLRAEAREAGVDAEDLASDLEKRMRDGTLTIDDVRRASTALADRLVGVDGAF